MLILLQEKAADEGTLVHNLCEQYLIRKRN